MGLHRVRLLSPPSTQTTHLLLQVIRLLLLLFLQSVQSALQCDYTYHHLQHRNISHLKHQLQAELRGVVVAPWDDTYETFRRIHNAACCQKPLLIARPTSQEVNHSVSLSLLQTISTIKYNPHGRFEPHCYILVVSNI